MLKGGNANAVATPVMMGNSQRPSRIVLAANLIRGGTAEP
jgi:hypothetical protein